MTSQNHIRVLLWSPTGAGSHYYGPGTSAYRLYRKSDERLVVTLAHGYRDQDLGLFHATRMVHPFSTCPLNQLRYIAAGRSWVRKNFQDFDIFHGLSAFAYTLSPALRAVASGLPAVVKVASRGTEVRPKGTILSGLMRAHERRISALNKLNAVIAISKEIADDLRAAGVEESRIVQISNGVDTEVFHPTDLESEREALRDSLRIRHRPTILFVGAIVSRKRPHLIIEALPILRSMVGDCQAIFVGPEKEPRYARALRRRASELAVNDSVIFAGHQPDIAPYYRAADVFCLPSEREGMANSVLEAMASGLPIVVTDVSGMREALGDDRTGNIVAPDSEQIADAIRDCLTDSSLYPGFRNASRRRANEHFSSSAILAKHRELFERLRAGGTAAS